MRWIDRHPQALFAHRGFDQAMGNPTEQGTHRVGSVDIRSDEHAQHRRLLIAATVEQVDTMRAGQFFTGHAGNDIFVLRCTC